MGIAITDKQVDNFDIIQRKLACRLFSKLILKNLLTTFTRELLEQLL